MNEDRYKGLILVIVLYWIPLALLLVSLASCVFILEDWISKQ